MIIKLKRVLAVLVALILSVTMIAYGEGDPWAWDCPDCERTGNTGNYCGGCGCPAPWITDSPGSDNLSSSVKVGDTILFGRYPQTAAGADETPIEWIVLEVDEANHRALLISKYGLNVKPYDDNNHGALVTWETCSLRTWLNEEFLIRAFTTEEQSVILLTDVDNSSSQGYSEWSTSGGNNTQDRIFLLSYAEANHYLNVTRNEVNNIASRIAPTAYAIKQGAYTSSSNNTTDGNAAGWWWLRSPGFDQYFAANVYYDGSLHDRYCRRGSGCVRPVLWVNLSSVVF